jgi:hypothetical protein
MPHSPTHGTAGVIREFPVPTPASRPYFLALGSDLSFWFTEAAGNKIGRITVPILVGDINGDAVVDIRDYGLWRQHFGQSISAAPGRSSQSPPGPAAPAISTATPTTR